MADKLKKITVELQTVSYKKWNVSGLWQYQRSTEYCGATIIILSPSHSLQGVPSLLSS
jgi:hypothetical protein